jgi:hypothetical protein
MTLTSSCKLDALVRMRPVLHSSISCELHHRSNYPFALLNPALFFSFRDDGKKLKTISKKLLICCSVQGHYTGDCCAGFILK